MDENLKFLEKLCAYCISNYTVASSGRLISTLIYQCGRKLDFDISAVEGILYVEINGYKRQYAHYFNVYKSSIIDASIYQYALIYKNVEDRFPLYVAGDNMPSNIEYSIRGEINYFSQFKFKDYMLDKIIENAYNNDIIIPKRFSNIEDGKKKNLFDYIK
ncbi:MAG: hypothetical protein PHX70_07020 [Clostridium sp.]|nr:hypothetical protein [Clostridium sp.]